MKKQQNNSSRAWALQIALSVALLSISAVLLASSFKATPASSGLSAPITPVAAGGNQLAIAGPASAPSLFSVDAPFTFDNTGSLNTARRDHTATLLSNGKVLVAGGYNGSLLASAELYDPASGTWTATGSLATARYGHTATLLPNGKVLVAGGEDTSFMSLESSELYDVGLGFSRRWQPEIATATLESDNSLFLTGSRFQGISQASSGNTQDSSSDYPIVQLRSIDSGEVVFLPVDPGQGWSHTLFISLPITGFHSGPALVTVFANGIPSAAGYVVVPP